MKQADAAAAAVMEDQDGPLDIEAIRQKYREERDKRVRPEGSAQFIKPTGDFSHFVDDPYVEPGFTRAALDDEVEILIVGGGFGGLIAGARLRSAGFEDVRIVESGGDFGGTWYWNRYPGAQCDIESYIYLPLLEETGYIPKLKYSFAPEIREHAVRIAKQYDLYRDVLFQTKIEAMTWLEEEGRWLISTDRGDAIKARHVIVSGGPLARPKLPGIPGIDRFKGHTFHTSRWDYDYTGGDTTGNLHKLADKKVALIGTGATAIQCTSHLGRHAEQLYVFQRTPSGVDARRNASTDPEWANSLTPGWQRRRMDNFNTLVNGGIQDEDLVADGWTDMLRKMGPYALGAQRASLTPEQLALATEIADAKKMNEIRDRTEAIVADKATAEALMAWYRQLCKRPTFNDDYLPTFNRTNVTLVDTMGRGVDEITETGLIFDGVEYQVDCIIFATGFEVGTSFTSRLGFDVIGRDGKALSDHFQNGSRTFHGFFSHGFPNYYNLGLRQNGYKANFVDMLSEQVEHLEYILSYARKNNISRIEPTEEAEAEWVNICNEKSTLLDAFLSQCTPGYYNAEGNPESRTGFFAQAYGGGPLEFSRMLLDWRSSGRLEGLDLS